MNVSFEELADEIRQHPRLVAADDFEISVAGERAVRLSYQDGEPALRTERDETWLGLRLIHRRQPGRALIPFSGAESLSRLVEEAFESARSSGVDPWFRFPLWKRAAPAPEADVASVTDAVLAYEPLGGGEEEYEVKASRLLLHRRTEKFQLSHSGLAHRASFRVGEASLTRSGPTPLEGRDRWLKALIDEATARASAESWRGDTTSGVLFGPAVSSRLLAMTGGWFRADRMQDGRSPFARFPAEWNLSDAVTLFDWGDCPDAADAAPFDAEGTARRRTLLVDKGVPQSWLYDVYSATRENRLSTGNFARPRLAHLPEPGPHLLLLAPGENRTSDLLSGCTLFVQSLDHVEFLADSDTRVSLVGTGWRVEGGELAEPVREIAFELDLLDWLRRMDAVGSDLTLEDRCGAPSTFCRELPK